jgi:hypothetical protein
VRGINVGKKKVLERARDLLEKQEATTGYNPICDAV